MPLLDNDLYDCYRRLSKFAYEQKIDTYIQCQFHNVDYETVNTSCIKDCMLDINRYLSLYKQVVAKHALQKANKLKNIFKK